MQDLDPVLVYDTTGWHLVPLAELGWGDDLDAAVSLADWHERTQLAANLEMEAAS